MTAAEAPALEAVSPLSSSSEKSVTVARPQHASAPANTSESKPSTSSAASNAPVERPAPHTPQTATFQAAAAEAPHSTRHATGRLTPPPSSTSKMRRTHSADDLLLALHTSSSSSSRNREDADEVSSAYSVASEYIYSLFASNERPKQALLDSMEEEQGNDDASVSSNATMRYFEPSDFLPQQNWEDLSASQIGIPIGFALVAGGLACFHPLVFVAGVLTAVGTLQAATSAHDYCSKTPSLLFCGHHDTTTGESAKKDGQATDTSKHAAEEAMDGQTESCQLESDENFSDDDPMRQVSLLTFSEESGDNLPRKIMQQRKQDLRTTASKDSTSTNVQNSQDGGLPLSASTLSHLDTQQALQWVQDFYPPLPTKALERVEFHGLNTKEFFDVFFADEAPFGFQAFHKIRRDKNIRYGLWEQLEGVKKPCLLAQAPAIPDETNDSNGEGHNALHIPPVQERIVQYEAKTNSFLGPPFARTTKVQRALQVSKKLLVMEMKTTLSDIPFSKNFYIMERWLVTSESHPEDLTALSDHKGRKRQHSGHIKKKMTSTAFLTITSQVIFTQTCAFESTILKESAKQITDISKQWNKMAQEGLKRTEETRRQRLQEEEDFESEHQLQEEKKEEAEMVASHEATTMSQEQQNAHENDESIEIQHMGRRNSWVAGDVYVPQPDLEEEIAVIKDGRMSGLNLSWKGKSARRSTSGRRSFSRSFSNMMARRRPSTLSATSPKGTVSPMSADKQVVTRTIPVTVVSVP